MASSQVVQFEAVRTLAFGSISGTYAAVGTPFDNPIRILCVTNKTDADMYFSFDGSTNQIVVPTNAFKLFDFGTNRYNRDQYYVLAADQQIYVKQVSAPSTGSVYVEAIY